MVVLHLKVTCLCVACDSVPSQRKQSAQTQLKNMFQVITTVFWTPLKEHGIIFYLYSVVVFVFPLQKFQNATRTCGYMAVIERSI